jgi:hypothetical protein
MSTGGEAASAVPDPARAAVAVPFPGATDAESLRLAEDARREKNWKRWGPYLSARQWGTVREDYSPDGDCWNYFTHEQARSRAYRWGEDGILGLTDRECRLCFAPAMWNGRDPILKERLFGLTGPEGNHGEDVKEQYFFLDSTPTHSYMRGLYKYPQAEFPYRDLVEENRRRGRGEPEYELLDTGVFDHERYFDVEVEYAKDGVGGGGGVDDILIRITATNRGPEAATLHLLPTLWFRNTWGWGATHEGSWARPEIRRAGSRFEDGLVAQHESLGEFRFWAEAEPRLGGGGRCEPPRWVFTNNETNTARLFGVPNASVYVKDGFHDLVVRGVESAVDPAERGTKSAAWYRLSLGAGEAAVVRLRLCAAGSAPAEPFGDAFEATFEARRREADEFYAARAGCADRREESRVVRQAYAGLLWSKQFYHYIVENWLDGDPGQPPPPPARKRGRNSDWRHLFNRDVISMPDTWEYPWYAAWDLAFHAVALARVDPQFAKDQLLLLLREWYMHPSGQIPAYEFNFSDVNPPVHAWACWRVYKITGARGHRDRIFLARAFHKLLINFTWWVNRKDPAGRHLFSGGFLGLDNIGVFDRSMPLPEGVHLDQADGTAWMAFYCGTMLSIALELASEAPEYEDVASKFFEHFVAITDAMNTLGGTGLWDEHDGFYYDQLNVNGAPVPLKVRSLVGIVPLLAVESLPDAAMERLAGFRKRTEWFLRHRRDLARHISYMEPETRDGGTGGGHRRLLAIPSKERLVSVLRYMLDENEFLSPHGVRSLSKYHKDHPFVFHDKDGRQYRVDYAPGESMTSMFGGNSNWRGPIWFPINYLIVEALERYHHHYGDALTVELPTGSGRRENLLAVSKDLRRRLASLFLPRPDGAGGGGRPCHGGERRFAEDPHWRDLLLFHEYFDGETGKGLGASHQTGWTALVASILHDH